MKKQFSLSKIFTRQKVILALILVLALGFRTFGFNWDQGFHLHPDERFLTMVATSVSWPDGLTEYFDTERSPLNPYNNGFDFFVYGPLPMFLTKLLADFLGLGQYASLNLVGRLLSAVFDVGTIWLLFKISKKLWPSLFYGLMVLPIQLSHFFAVDTFLTFFLVFSFYLTLERKGSWGSFAGGLIFGLALSCKASAILFFPFLLATLFLKRKQKGEWVAWLWSCLLLTIGTLLAFRVFNPYAFLGWGLNPQFLANLKTLNSFNNPEIWFPPAVQWIKTTKIIFPLINLAVWGVGLPFFLLLLFSLTKIRKKSLGGYFLIACFWSGFLLIFQGVQFVKTMRYFLPIYPFLALIVGSFEFKRLKYLWPVLLIPSLAFVLIYRRPHTRVQASDWILKEIPAGSVISCEHWDDCLPLENSSQYRTETLNLYDPDTSEKWLKIAQQLSELDYLILSSNRLWGSIPKVPEKYPQTSRYFPLLMEGKLGFEKVADFTSYPIIPDDWAEEAFTVYDHPRVMIFANRARFNSSNIYSIIFPN